MSYAEGTQVSEAKTRLELEKILTRMGAAQFGVMTDYENRLATIAFVYKRVQVQMQIPLPNPKDRRFTHSKNGAWLRSPEAAKREVESEVRRRWRCLLLAIKAKLVAVQDGICTFEREFLPYMVCADGTTIADKLAPLIEEAQRTGVVASSLRLSGPTEEPSA